MANVASSPTEPDPDDRQYREPRQEAPIEIDRSLITIEKGNETVIVQITEPTAWISDTNPIDLTEAL